MPKYQSYFKLTGKQPPINDSYLKGLEIGYDMAVELISVSSHYEMTIKMLHIAGAIPGITKASSYEVFNRSSKPFNESCNNDLLFRRFPLSLDEGYRDANTELLGKLVIDTEDQYKEVVIDNMTYIFMQVLEVFPLRVILLEGTINPEHRPILQGLHKVYSSQTALLDTKERDSLTHLLNRHSLEQTLKMVKDYHLTTEARQDIKPSWLALMDIDFFKSINDQFGHIYGDEVLLHFASLLEKNMRHTDFLFRYGGEEFVVILNDSCQKGAEECFERFRKEVEKFAFPSGKVTVSIGYTRIEPAKASEQLLEEADKSVYFAKENGRNQVVNYSNMDKQPMHFGGDVELF